MTTLAVVPSPPEPTPLTLPATFSMSRLKTAGECMRKAWLDDQADTAGEPAGIGDLVHEIAATAALQARMLGVERLTVEEFEGIARRVIRNPAGGVEALSEAAWQEVHRLVRRLAYAHEFPAGVECEVYSSRELDGRIVSARIDWRWIDGAVCWIQDWKSGGKRAAEEPTTQLKVYCWETLGTHPDLEGFWVRENAIPYGESEWVWLNAEELTGPGSIEEWLSDMLARFIAAYAAPPLAARPDPAWCQYCPDPEGCPLPDFARPGSDVRTEADAIAQLDAAIVLRARAKRATAAARGYLDGRQRTHITSTEHGKEYGYSADGSRCTIRESRTEDT